MLVVASIEAMRRGGVGLSTKELWPICLFLAGVDYDLIRLSIRMISIAAKVRGTKSLKCD